MAIVSVVLLATIAASSQQTPLVNNYKMNYFTINPAASGNMGHWAMRGQFRGEWVRFPGAPVTETFSMSGPVGASKKIGLGLVLFNDAIGPEGRYGITGGYSYHLPIGDENTLAIGIGTRLFRYKLDLNEIKLADPSDPGVVGAGLNEGLSFDFGAGAYFTGSNFYAGVSAPVLAQAVGPDIAKSVLHYYAMLGYKWFAVQSGSGLHIEPSVLVKGASGSLQQLDANVKLHLVNEQLFVGGGVRALNGSASTGDPWTGMFVSTMIGAKLLDRYHFAYSYDFAVGDGSLQPYTWGSHEVMLGWDFDWKPKSRYASAN